MSWSAPVNNGGDVKQYHITGTPLGDIVTRETSLQFYLLKPETTYAMQISTENYGGYLQTGGGDGAPVQFTVKTRTWSSTCAFNNP